MIYTPAVYPKEDYGTSAEVNYISLFLLQLLKEHINETKGKNQYSFPE